jgi:predicted component of type VI protein secretion system
MPAQLVAMTEGPSILLDKPILLLGRDLECDIRLDCRKISRRHCCIALLNEQLVVRDLGSTNGIRINGVRVVEGYLKEGDELTIGNHRYQVRWDAAGPPRREPPVRPSDLKEPDPPRKKTALAQPDSDPLDSCDQPIPLADSSGGMRAGSRDRGYPAAPPVSKKAPAANYQPDGLAPATAKRPVPGALPDEIGLAPASDLFPIPISPRKPPKRP